MNAMIASALSISLALIPCANAQVVSPMKVSIEAEAREQVKSVLLSSALEDREVARSTPVVVDIDASSVERKNSTLSVVWSDDSTTSFPIHVSTVFGGKRFAFYFRKDETRTAIDSKATDQCVEEVPPTIRQVFQRLYYCRSLAKAIEATNNLYVLQHRRALSGWFAANVALYTRSSPGPYGVDPELLKRLREILKVATENKYAERAFQPLLLSEVRKLIKLVEEENISLAALLPELIRQGRLQDAKQLNNLVYTQFDDLSRQRGVLTIQGLSRDMLLANDKYIERLAGGS
jgi:hypothetical protein